MTRKRTIFVEEFPCRSYPALADAVAGHGCSSEFVLKWSRARPVIPRKSIALPELPMTEAEFHALAAQGYNRIPVTLETLRISTPLRLSGWPTLNTYLLESAGASASTLFHHRPGRSTRIEVHTRCCCWPMTA